jgi:hypothetical protein
MPEVAVSGNDTFQLAGRNFTSFADGSNAEIVYDNDLLKFEAGKNGNTLIAGMANGRLGKATLRIIRRSADDLFLNSMLQIQAQGLESFPLMNGQFVKRIGNGQGVVNNDTYKMKGGAFLKRPGAVSNVSGDTNQSLVEYQIMFTDVSRQLL